MAKLSIGLQLYTVRDLVKTDMAGALAAAARIGFEAVELAGFGNLKTAGEARKALDDNGLKVCGAHIGIDSLEKDLNRVLDEQQTVGNPLVVCPWLPDARRKTAADWHQLAGSLNAIAARCAARGIGLAYHNHNFEFDKFGEKTGMDILWGSADAKLVKSELDVYWVKYAGLDPVAYLNQLGTRVSVLHLKDMSAGPERKFAEVGTGIIDFKSLLSAGQKLGIRWGVVEQDNCYQTPPLEAIRRSFENLKALND